MLHTLTEWVSDPAVCSRPSAALLSSTSVSSQPFKASTHSTRSRASRRPEVWTGSTRGCPPAATASNTKPPPAWTTCRPAPGLQKRTAPTHRPRTSPFISPLLLLLLSFLPPSFLLFSSKSWRRSSSVQATLTALHLIYHLSIIV